MKLTYYPFEPFEIDDGRPTVIETNNYEFYQKLILNFKDLEDEINLSDDNFECIDVSKAIHWIGDPMMDYDVNKLFQLKLYKLLLGVMTEEYRQKIINISRNFKAQILEMSFLLDLPLKIDDQMEFIKAFKYSGIQFDFATLHKPYDIIETVLKLLNELDESRVICFMNVSDYLNEEKMKDFVNLVGALNSKTILIKFSEIQRPDKFNDCRYYYIDADFVDWKY